MLLEQAKKKCTGELAKKVTIEKFNYIQHINFRFIIDIQKHDITKTFDF